MIVAIAIAGIVAAAVWYLVFSGRAPTATKESRAKVWHVLFLTFFSVYVLGLLAWMVAGLLPAIAHHVPSLHERLHAYGGAADVIDVTASEIEPFGIEGSQRIREMTFREGTLAVIHFTNEPTYEEAAFPHNIAVLDDGGRVLFQGETSTPRPGDGFDDFGSPEERDIFDPETKVYAFQPPRAGTYIYVCSIHPDRMRGTVRVLDANAPGTQRDHPGLRDMARRIAAASHRAEGSVADIVLDYAFSALTLGLGVFLVVLRPRERMARVFGLAMVGTAAAYNLQSHAALAVHSAFDDTLHFNLHPLTGFTYIYALILFPDGRLVPRWSNRLARVSYRAAVFVAIFVLLAATGAALPDFGQHPAALVLVMGIITPVLGIAAQTYRLRRAENSEKRQQSRLLLWATLASLGLGVVLLVALDIDLRTLIDPTVADPTVIGANERLAFRVFQPLFAVIPIALFAGILRYRLWAFDFVFSRTLVYGTLAGFIGALYVGIVVVLGGALGGRVELSILATVLAGVAFDPLRARLQRVANRLVYGERSSPYEVMAEVSRRLARADSPEAVVAGVAEAAARAVGASRARATMTTSSGEPIVAGWPAEPEGEVVYDRIVPVTHRDEQIGEVAVAKRPGDPLRPGENRLLEALATQVGTAMQSVRLAEQLRARLSELQHAARELAGSRARLMRAADAERRRLEKQIHDGVESALVDMSEQLSKAERAFGRSRTKAVGLLEGVAAEANRTQEKLRELARGIFPPLLTDKGVQPALESQVRKMPSQVIVSGSLTDRFDPRAEAAVYFCCIEALRRAGATTTEGTMTIELGRDNGWVRFAVRGSGEIPGGEDLQLLMDRVEAVGGSLEVSGTDARTEMTGRVPAQVAAAQTSASRSGSNADLGT
jgi:signal transduction histidine kinase